MTSNLIEELAAVKDKFPAGSMERSVIWTAIEHLRGENAEIVRLRGEVALAAGWHCTGDEMRCFDGHGCECAMNGNPPPANATIAPAEAKGEAKCSCSEVVQESDGRLSGLCEVCLAYLRPQPARSEGRAIGATKCANELDRVITIIDNKQESSDAQ